MSKPTVCIFLTAAFFFLSAAALLQHDSENVLEVDGFRNEETKEDDLLNKCYDEETKSTYKVDSNWLSNEKCERRICTRQRDSKTPIIKTMKCEQCTTCDLSTNVCEPVKVGVNYPKCCPLCLPKPLKKKKIIKKY
ncbi:uncharacterized protein LOC112693411 [Sipha flava]|uniref:Uncharacterized protein LOC112693411 n=1 Tax=Sipha flava TaxID=143950 RepID=A0A8B8GNS4_9HEMI|nr:uncharacterized protein LOC112693411 [Sipha flava]